jgi:KipI family sensor histidine kinase inhibitor
VSRPVKIVRLTARGIDDFSSVPAMNQKTEKYFIGESCLCISLGDSISPVTSSSVLSLYADAKKMKEDGQLDVLDIVPSYTALALYFDPVSAEVQKIGETLDGILANHGSTGEAASSLSTPRRKRVVLPVRYDGEDIGRVAAHNNLSSEEVIRLHSKGIYTVAMIGFLPHFPYLLGLDKKLATPRLERPRTHVAAGSVAIGGEQTGVYPSESPGGWNIVGTTDPALLMPIVPGDEVVFERL